MQDWYHSPLQELLVKRMFSTEEPNWILPGWDAKFDFVSSKLPRWQCILKQDWTTVAFAVNPVEAVAKPLCFWKWNVGFLQPQGPNLGSWLRGNGGSKKHSLSPALGAQCVLIRSVTYLCITNGCVLLTKWFHLWPMVRMLKRGGQQSGCHLCGMKINQMKIKTLRHRGPLSLGWALIASTSSV